ncbi:MalY/PatB family protein [Octadecabacter sp. R77987]|uniref:MalY/PatB family protein n=1 Tax=Octadecabacter sp. R77987 TaxID=3093874 RepID=UPI00367212AC
MSADFDFDAVIDRRAVPALKTHPMVVGADGADLFAAGVADMDFRVAPAITNAMTQRAQHGIFGYEAVPADLMPALIDWVATRHSWDIDQSHILRSPNVLNSLAIAASLFSQTGDGIIVQPPVFFDFYDIIRENHRTVVENPLVLTNGRYEMDFEGLETLAANPNNKILFLCNPHNPVGRVWSKEELTKLGEICAQHGVLVVSDELHGDITFAGHRYTPFASLGPEFARNAVTLLSPAKSFNIAGCCWSFTVVPDDTRRQAFSAENSRLTVNKNNAFSSVAIVAAYRDGGPWLDAVMAYLGDNLALVRQRIQAMAQVTLIAPEGTFLLWIDFRALGITPDELTAFLRQGAGWAVTRGIAFGPQGAGFARLNIACPRAKLEMALDGLAAALDRL